MARNCSRCTTSSPPLPPPCLQLRRASKLALLSSCNEDTRPLQARQGSDRRHSQASVLSRKRPPQNNGKLE
eukprot:14482428-Alexandrium_andersonii.AAC.1